jgi:hypothetical protein
VVFHDEVVDTLVLVCHEVVRIRAVGSHMVAFHGEVARILVVVFHGEVARILVVVSHMAAHRLVVASHAEDGILVVGGLEAYKQVVVSQLVEVHISEASQLAVVHRWVVRSN